MADVDTIADRVRSVQVTIGRIAEKNGMTLKAISLGSGIPYNTVRSYFTQERDAAVHLMPVSALLKLIGVLPDEWLSLLFEAEGRCLINSKNEQCPERATLAAAHDALGRILGRLPE